MINWNDNGYIDMIVQAFEMELKNRPDQVLDKSAAETWAFCELYRIQGHQTFVDLRHLAAILSEGFSVL